VAAVAGVSVGLGRVPRVAAKGELDQVTMGGSVEPGTMDPHMHANRWTLDVQNQCFDQLIHRDPKARMVPGLATTWRQRDERTWRFELRRGVTFHGGEPFDAETVKYTYDRIMDPATKSPITSSLRLVEKVTVVDAHTLDIATKAPAPVLPAYLSLYTNIVSKPWMTAKGPEFAARNMNGTGAFRFGEWRKGEHIKLARNDAYWGGKPQIKNVTIRPIPDANSRVLALQKGEVDIIQDLPAALADDIKKHPDLRVSAVPSIRVHFLVLRTDVKPLDDPRVRQALNYAVNKDAITKQLLRGYAHPLPQILTPAMFGHAPDIPGYPYSPDRARALLREAGVPKGFSTEISGPVLNADVIEAVAGNLREIGVEATIRIEEQKVNYENLLKKKATPLHYLSWGNWNLFDADGTIPFLYGDTQWSYYTPPARFVELNRIGSTVVDGKKRAEAYHELMRICQAEAPLLLLYQQFDINAANRKTTFETRYDNVMLLHDTEKA
jgi:peptide/nickel transport system substrate-binding protein